MKQITVKFDKVKLAKLMTARKDFSPILTAVSEGITEFTQRKAQGDASPEEVVDAFIEKVLPAMEQTTNMIESIVEAIPAGDSDGGLDLGDDNKNDMFGDHDDDDDDDDDDDNPLVGNVKDMDKRLKEQEERTASLLKENIQMKKAKLAVRLASSYPPNQRKAAEEDFLKREEEEDDLDKLEAKVVEAETLIKGYQTANMINRSRMPATSGYSQLTAKQTTKDGKLRTANAPKIDWRLRT